MSVLRPSQSGSTFAWLLDHGVTSDSIAALLQTTAVNVRVVASRFQKQREWIPRAFDPFSAPPNSEQRQDLGIPHPDEVVANKGRTRKLENYIRISAILREPAGTSISFEAEYKG